MKKLAKSLAAFFDLYSKDRKKTEKTQTPKGNDAKANTSGPTKK